MIVNGKEISIQELKKPTIEELLKKYEINHQMIAIEINGTVIPRSKWNHIQLNDSDKIELIRFVGGG